MVDDSLRTEYRGRILAAQSLPTLPAVRDEVTRLVEDPGSSTEQIAKVIAYDQVLSAKVLKMVNSPIYGFPGRIGSVQHALVLLGYNVVRGLIVSTAVFDDMSRAMTGLWDHSVGCSLACGELARTLALKDPEEYAVAGLLHDLGKVVTAVQLPDARKELDALVSAEDITYREAEKRVLGFAHDRINAWVGERWNLPAALREGMAWHHRPMGAPNFRTMACVVHIGDFLVRLYEFGSGGDDNVPLLDPHALKHLGMGQKVLETVLDGLDGKFVEVSGLGFA